MYSSIALQYLTLYSGIAGELENNRLVSEKHLFETLPEFDEDIEEQAQTRGAAVKLWKKPWR